MDLAAASAAHNLDARVADLDVDVEHLVNNAGFGILGVRFQDCDPEEVSRMIRLNVLTVTDLTMLHVRRMVKRSHGSILNVSSIAGYVVPQVLRPHTRRRRRTSSASPNRSATTSRAPG